MYIWYSSQPSQKVYCSKYWCVQLYALLILIFSSAAWLTALDLIFLFMAQLKMLHQPAILSSVDADWRQHRVWVNDIWKTNWNELENYQHAQKHNFIQTWNAKSCYSGLTNNKDICQVWISLPVMGANVVDCLASLFLLQLVTRHLVTVFGFRLFLQASPAGWVVPFQ